MSGTTRVLRAVTRDADGLVVGMEEITWKKHVDPLARVWKLIDARVNSALEAQVQVATDVKEAILSFIGAFRSATDDTSSVLPAPLPDESAERYLSALREFEQRTGAQRIWLTSDEPSDLLSAVGVTTNGGSQ
jgi:hypothetical protein